MNAYILFESIAIAVGLFIAFVVAYGISEVAGQYGENGSDGLGDVGSRDVKSRAIKELVIVFVILLFIGVGLGRGTGVTDSGLIGATAAIFLGLIIVPRYIVGATKAYNAAKQGEKQKPS